jgi:hypothetical protein
VKSGQGTVTSAPPGPLQTIGKPLRFTAKPATGWIVRSWTGCKPANPLKTTCIISKVTKAAVVRVVFVKK